MAEMTFEEMEQKLAYLGTAARSVCRLAINKGAKVLALRQQSAAPLARHSRKIDGRTITPGGMRESIGWRPMKTVPEISGGKAGLDVGRRKPGIVSKAAHGHLYVQGTDHRYRGFVRARGYPNTKYAVKRTNNKIGYTGRSPAHLPSFIKTASQAAESEVMQVVVDAIASGIIKAVEKQGG